MVHSRALLPALFALSACAGQGETPLEPATAANPLDLAAAVSGRGLSICSWALANFATSESYLAIVMHADRTIEITQYINFPEPPSSQPRFYINSEPVAGLVTLQGDSVVLVKGNLPASSYSSPPEGEIPPSDTTAITLALDLRVTVTPTRGTGWKPDGQGSFTATRFLRLSGTVDGVQVALASEIAKAGFRGRFGDQGGAANPFHWFGSSGDVRFCTS
jgi:hypothetical protein